MGAFSLSSPLDARDIHNYDQVTGPNPHHLAGHYPQKPMPSSVHPPAPGHTLYLDIRKLKEKSPQGYTHSIQVISEFEGYFAVLPAKSASGEDLFNAVYSYISTTYNAVGHKVVTAHADAESVMKSMRAHFGSIGVTLTLSPPGQHAQRVERYTQTMDNRARSTLDALPYELPPAFLIYLDINVANCMNYVPNSRSFPLTPYEKVHKCRKRFHESMPFLPFGSVCMVSMGEAKRAKNAKDLEYPIKSSVKQEVGVCLGEDPAFPQSYIFYVNSTKQVVPRRVCRVLATSVVPFGWTPKASMFQLLKQFPVDMSIPIGPNVPIQPRSTAPFPVAPYVDHVLQHPTPNEPYRLPMPLPLSLVPPLPTLSSEPSLTATIEHTPTIPAPSVSVVHDTPPLVPVVEQTLFPPSPKPILPLPLPDRSIPTPRIPRSAEPSPLVRQSSRSTRGIRAPILEYEKLGGANSSSSFVSAINCNCTCPQQRLMFHGPKKHL